MARKNIFKTSSNPFMSDRAYGEAIKETGISRGETMTVNGAVNKSFILLAIMLATAAVSYTMPSTLFMIGGAIGGLIMVFIALWKKEKSAIFAPAYAAFEGLFLGSLSAMYASLYSGIIFQAVTLTTAILFMMLFIYKTGIIKVTAKFRMGVFMATGAIVLVYILNWVMSFFGMSVPYLHEGGTIGIVISLVIIGVASLNLLLDFDNFDKGEQYREPKYMEWFSAMGLMITLVWLYVEILRLLSIFSGDD